MLDSVSLRTLQAALDGLAVRERTVGDNIANVNTPFFTARRVTFERELRSALADGIDPLTLQAGTEFTSDPAGLTGNNVSLEQETLIGVDTNLRYELVLRATGDQFSLLRTAARAV